VRGIGWRWVNWEFRQDGDSVFRVCEKVEV